MDPEKAAQCRNAAVWTAVLATAHFALGTRTHSIHGLHILLGGLFLIPVLIAAVAFEVRGGLVAAATVSTLYALHLVWSWRDSTMGNLDQWTMVGVYFVVGVAGGSLVSAANVRKWQRDEVLRRSRQTESIRGLTGLLAGLEVRDADTLDHCRRTAEIVVRLGDRLRFDKELTMRLRLAASVHDIDTAAVPDDVLFDGAALSGEQKAVMCRHVDRVVMMLQSIADAEDISRLVRMHHECPDGSGYPDGLKADEITPEANALRVADVFCTLTEARPNRAALAPQQALAKMSEWSGTKIDKVAFEALREVMTGVQESPSRIVGSAESGGLPSSGRSAGDEGSRGSEMAAQGPAAGGDSSESRAGSPPRAAPSTEEGVAQEDEGPPFGPAFFLGQLRGMIRDHCPSPDEGLPQVQIHLVNEEILDLCHVIGVTPSWVALAVFEHGHGSTVRQMRTELIPCVSISRVTIRMAPVDDSHVGFNADHGPWVFDRNATCVATPEAAIRAVRGHGDDEA